MQKLTFVLQKLPIFVWVSFLLTISIQAQDKEFESPLKKDTWALQFGIGDNFTLNSFQGGFISAKYMCNKNEGLRIGLSLGYSKADSDNKFETYFANDSGNSHENSESKRGLIQLNANYLYHFLMKNRIVFLLGVGPTIGYQNNDLNTSSENYYNSTIEKGKNKRWELGINTEIGVEWLVTESISLLASYNSRYYYYWNDAESVRTQTNKADGKINNEKRINDKNGIQLFASSVLFGVSVYL